MSQWIDEKYIHLLSGQLSHFRKQSRYTYTFRCPLCGDSEKRKNKTRGYFFLHQQKYFFKCHNCNASQLFMTFLRERDEQLYREYQLDLLRENDHAAFPSVASVPPVEQKPHTNIQLTSIAELPTDHPAVMYCHNRRIPTQALSRLFFTDRWASWVQNVGLPYTLEEDEAPRLVIPWFDRQNNMLGAQCRRIDVTGSAGRYVTLKFDHTEDKIYGWERVDFHKPIYIVEGPIDSLFIPNAVASMDADLLRLQEKYFALNRTVLVWDNEPRNLAVAQNVQAAVKAGFATVIWPSGLPKDINDMVLAGHDPVTIIQQNTFQGLRAELEYVRWKKMSI